jgi:GDPmannose 4,6-dehydratase
VFAANGILFNHESPRRGETVVTGEISQPVAQITAGRQEAGYLGNLDARRDWGYAPDYVLAMWMMLQLEEPADLVLSTGEQHSVQEFAELAFGLAGLDWRNHVRLDEAYLRPAEVDTLLGDSAKARSLLGWSPTIAFPELVRLLVEADINAEGLDPKEVMARAPGGPAVVSR